PPHRRCVCLAGPNRAPTDRCRRIPRGRRHPRRRRGVVPPVRKRRSNIVIAFEKVQGGYCRDILEQPRALHYTVDGLEPLPALEAVRENLRTGRLRRIVLTGMGGSYQILHPLHLRLLAAGFDSIMAETSELLYSMPALLDSHNVVIAVS